MLIYLLIFFFWENNENEHTLNFTFYSDLRLTEQHNYTVRYFHKMHKISSRMNSGMRNERNYDSKRESTACWTQKAH